MDRRSVRRLPSKRRLPGCEATSALLSSRNRYVTGFAPRERNGKVESRRREVPSQIRRAPDRNLGKRVAIVITRNRNVAGKSPLIGNKRGVRRARLQDVPNPVRRAPDREVSLS